jgi:eukaryotic-like serine/threonine-protein kinase
MTLTIGTQLGSHEIIALLGTGGMGVVYRARDRKLERDVAIKTLPQEFTSDADRLGRFQREAKLLASLNHPNIGAIYGLEEFNSTPFLILELVEGETLTERLKRSPLAVEESLKIAIDIADALEEAHDKGVIHRDLKPGNIKITPEGKVKVLDFGLAKAVEGNEASPVLSNSPTLTNAATLQGVILGTAAYMSPEQAKGRAVTRAADIWAFGCVLYEMLTGRPVFEGEDVADILGAVLKTDPDWTRLPPETPPSIRRLLQLCLEKNPRNRCSDASDVRIDIEHAQKGEEYAPAAVPASSSRMLWTGWIAAGVMAIALASMGLLYFHKTLPQPAEMRVDIATPVTSASLDFALAPDGQSLVFVASGDGQQRLWLRRLDKADAQRLAGTEDATLPFWSPDSRSIGFFASGKLKRIDISGDSLQVIAIAPGGRGGAWNADNTIVFTPTAEAPLLRVAAGGGETAAATVLGTNHVGHRFPKFLPDGKHFLFYVQSSEKQGIYLASLANPKPKFLTAADTEGAVVRPDQLLFVRQGNLVTQQVDLEREELLGSPHVIATHVGFVFSHAGISVSDNGLIAYRAGGADSRQLVWRDRAGKALGTAGQKDMEALLAPSLSPDGRRIAVDRTVQGNRDVWLIEPLRGGLTRFTFDASVDGFPIWSPDGKQIAFESTRSGHYGLYLKPSNLVGAEETFAESPNNRWPLDWSQDGRFILFHEDNPKTGIDLLAWPMKEKDPKVIPVATTAFAESAGEFSPDGHLVAFDTNESGQFQVVVQPFPNPTGKWQISTAGRDGKELYFLAPDGKLMAAPIHTSASGIEPETPVPLFQTRMFLLNNRQQYAVSADGRFLLNEVIEDASAPPITLILNWHPEQNR